MELNEDSNIAACGPEFYGAIFMTDRAVKKECFKRKLFGLPRSQIPFVKRVKCGMILFLFEFEERKLYGVYRATCDGAVDIDPSAFSSAERPLSAQIRFKIIGMPPSLSENEFREAIKDNYYTPKKFDFCLSKVQVEKLLDLFHARGTNIQHPLRLRAPRKGVTQFKNCILDSSVRVLVKNNSIENDFDMDNGITTAETSKYSVPYRPNVDSYGPYKKSNIKTREFMGDGEVLPSVIPHSPEIRMSNPLPLISCNNSAVNFRSSPPHGHPGLCTAVRFQYKPTFSSCVEDDPRSMEYITSRPMGLAENSFPRSREPIYQRGIDPVTLDAYPEYLHLGVPSNAEGYKVSTFPDRHMGISSNTEGYKISTFSEHETINAKIPSRYRYYDQKIINSANIEGYEGLSSHDQYESYMSMMKSGRYGKKNIHTDSLPCSSGRDLHDLYDYIYPAAPPHEGKCEAMEACCYEPSIATARSSEADGYERIINHLQFSRNPEIFCKDGYEMRSFHQPKCHKECCRYFLDMSSQSDAYNKKASVFSRLSAHSKVGTDDDDYEYIVDLSSGMKDHFQRKKVRRVVKKVNFRSMNNFGKHIDRMDMDTTASIAFESKEEALEKSRKSNELEIPFCNFKRRNDAQKTASETAVKTAVDDGSSAKNKRRKLIRPSLTTERSTVDSKSKSKSAVGLSRELGENSSRLIGGEVIARKEEEAGENGQCHEPKNYHQSDINNVNANGEGSSRVSAISLLAVGTIIDEEKISKLSACASNECSN